MPHARRCTRLCALAAFLCGGVAFHTRLPYVCRCPPPRCCDSSLECDFYGVSFSDSGLVALISAGGRTIPIAVTDTDKESASSPQALCLLQLLQQIDLGGPAFPPEALSDAVGASAMLRAVEIDSSSGFSLSVASSAVLNGVVTDVRPFEALALALRYNSPLRADAGLFASAAAFAESECPRRFPCAYTRQDARLQSSAITRQLAGLSERPDVAKAPTAEGADEGASAGADEGSGGRGFSFADQGSLDIVEAVAQALPPQAPRRRIDGPDAALLRGALEIARRRGDAAAEQKM